MNVACPSCETVYRIDPDKVPEQGIRARCATCAMVIPVSRYGDEPAVSQGADRSATVVPDPVVSAAPESAPPIAVPTPAPPAAGWEVPPYEAPVQPPEPRVFAEPEQPPDQGPPDQGPWISLEAAPEPELPAFAADRGSAADRVVPPVVTPERTLELPPEPPAPPDVEPSIDLPWVAPPTAEQVPVQAPVPEPEAREPRPPPRPRLSRPFVQPRVEGEPENQPARLRPPRPSAPVFRPTPGQPVQPTPVAGTPAPSRPAAQPSAQPPVNPFLARDPKQKARRLARALVSDMIVYQPEKRQEALAAGTIKAAFEEEIKKSWGEYVQQVGEELANSTGYFTEALNEILAGGQKVF